MLVKCFRAGSIRFLDQYSEKALLIATIQRVVEAPAVDT